MNTGKGRQVYKVVAEYQPEGHPNYRKEFVVRQDEFESAKSTGKIPVTYLADKPTVSAAGAEIHADMSIMAAGAGVFVVALLVLLVSRNMTKQMAAGMPGSAQQAA